MKRILCFGDSNTWGLIPGTDKRFADGVRWTSIIRNDLEQSGYEIIEEGLCGRTTVFEDPDRIGRAGDKLLPVFLESHAPLDMVIIMLGTNDCKPVYNADAETIAHGAERLIKQVRAYAGNCRVLLISPIELGNDVWQEGYDPQFDAGSPAVSRNLKYTFAKVARKHGTDILAASDHAKPSSIDCERERTQCACPCGRGQDTQYLRKGGFINQMTKKQLIRHSFIKSLPVLCSYLFLGMAYGMMMAEAGYQWYYSLFSCLFLYSGTCQFLLITFFSSGASLLTVALTFLKDFSAMGKRKLYMIHSMTDETYAVNTTLDYMPEDDKHSTMFGVALFSHFYWTFFSVLGSVIGQLLPFQLEGVDFCMTALFVIIFIDKWEHADRHSPALIGLGVGVLCLLIFGQNSFMLPALLLSTALLLLITNTDFGKKKGKKDKDTDGENAESKTDSKKIEVVTSPEDIVADEKEERKI